MGSTNASLHYHVIFGTKDRTHALSEDWGARVHAYIAGSVKGLGGHPHEIGGVADHVHLLFGLRPAHCLSDVVREIKKASSKWIHDEIGLSEFGWQEGYGAFTVSPTALGNVTRYIRNQKIHHQKVSFQEELARILEEVGVTFENDDR